MEIGDFLIAKSKCEKCLNLLKYPTLLLEGQDFMIDVFLFFLKYSQIIELNII